MNQRGETAASLRPILPFFGLLLALSVPFWLLETISSGLPGWFPENLPVSALMALLPGVVAAILLARRGGAAAVRRLLVRAADWRKITPLWWVLIVAVMPAVYLLTYALMWLAGAALPEPSFAWSALPLLAVMYLIAGLAEELGWCAYATDLLRKRWSVLTTGAVLGVAWALWHLIPYLQGGNSTYWVIGQCLSTVAFRIVIVAGYEATRRSVFAAAVIHASSNLAWNMFPNNGSGHDPAFTTAILAGLIAAVWVYRRSRRPVRGLAGGRCEQRPPAAGYGR